MTTDPFTLLLVDDHRMLRESLRRSLEASGIGVAAEAADGAEAVRLALQLQPDVVLMDVSMPGMDGIEATRRIKRRLPQCQVVVLTMHADEDVLSRALLAGADGYLVKDCSVDEVVRTVSLVARGQVVLSLGHAAAMRDEVQRLGALAAANPVTSREEEVLQLIADGCATPEVAERLLISQTKVKDHLSSIYRKLDVRDRTQAVVRAVRMGFVRLE